MSMKRTVVTAQTSFQREQHYIKTNTDTAKRLLRDPHRLAWFADARRVPGQDPEFKVNVWRCPYCGSAHLDYRKNTLVGAVREKEFVDFFDDQTSLFEQEKEHRKEIHFQDVGTDDGEHQCKKCGKISTPDSEPLIVIFQRTKTRSKNELKVTLLHVALKDLLTISGLTDFRIENVDPRVPFTESVVFNFNRGKTFLTLQEEGYLERVVAVRDLTNSIWSDGPLFRAIFLHPLVSLRFYEQFNNAYPEENPFPREEMAGPMQYVHLCRFQGFPRFFYDSIPFSLKRSVTLEAPFRTAAKNLHKRDYAIAKARRELPYDTKEIRRILFEKPGFFFFIKQLKAMGEVLRVTIEDLRHMKRYAKREESQLEELANCISRDLFVRYLQLPSAVAIAAEILAYPGTIEFLRILLKQIGIRRILSFLEHAPSHVFEMGERYACASPFKKKEMLNASIAYKYKNTSDSLSCSCSEPVPRTVNGDLKEMQVGNYLFKPVTYKQEYRKAADQLHNCLMYWCYNSDPTPVVIVYYHFKIIAAVEVRLDIRAVMQAYLSYNRDLDNDPDLYQAYKKWLNRSGLMELERSF